MMPTMRIVVLQAQLRQQSERAAELEMELQQRQIRLAVERSKLDEIRKELAEAVREAETWIPAI